MSYLVKNLKLKNVINKRHTICFLHSNSFKNYLQGDQKVSSPKNAEYRPTIQQNTYTRIFS